MARHAIQSPMTPSDDAALATAPGEGARLTRVSPMPARAPSARLGVIGVLMLLVAAWGAIVPFVGPSFGYSADGAPSWYWSLSHAVLWLAPGAGAFVAAIIVVGLVPLTSIDRATPGLAAAGLLAVICGGWFVIGPIAWPALYSTTPVFAHASPLREFAYQVGYSFGPGLLIATLGGTALGWTLRNRPNTTTVTEPSPQLARSRASVGVGR